MDQSTTEGTQALGVTVVRMDIWKAQGVSNRDIAELVRGHFRLRRLDKIIDKKALMDLRWMLKMICGMEEVDDSTLAILRANIVKHTNNPDVPPVDVAAD
jgi:hypothetical protein